MRNTMTNLAAQTARLKATLDQVQPQAWIAKGAPEAYVGQHRSIQAEMGYLIGSTQQLSKQPEKLSLALEAMFRWQAVEALLLSLAEGVERYQNPSLAGHIRTQLSESAVTRDKLRHYVVDLATTKEQEASVLEQEAQRCRAFLSKQPRTPVRKKKQE